METLTAKEITQQTWNVLQSMEDQLDDPIFIQVNPTGSYLALSYIDFLAKPISRRDAYNKISEAVTKSLKEHDKVYLYFCPDNALISIEYPGDIPDDELDLFYQEANNFYIAKD